MFRSSRQPNADLGRHACVPTPRRRLTPRSSTIAKAAAADPRDCTRSNANTMMRVPTEFGNPATCFMHAQAYIAETSFGQELDRKDLVRIMCVRRDAAAASR